MRELIDEPALWARTVALLVECGLATDAADLAARCAPYLGTPAVDLPLHLSRKDLTGAGTDARRALAALLG